MQRLILSLAMVLIVAIASHTSAKAQTTPPRHVQDTGHITIVFDGHDYTASAVAYVIEGRLYISGIWVHDTMARYGTDAMASAYLLRVENKVGEHPIEPETIGETLFSTVYSGPVADKAYAIFRSDELGGNGMITILSITDQSVRGTFTFTAYNKDKPTEFRTVQGRFDVPYRLVLR